MQAVLTRLVLSNLNTSSAFRGFSRINSGLQNVASASNTSSWGAQTVRQLSAGGYSDLPLDTGRRRLVVLGSGWAAARLAKDISPRLYDITV